MKRFHLDSQPPKASVSWCNLPWELVGKIACYLTSRTDQLRLRSVCSALRHHPYHRHRCPIHRVIPNDGGFHRSCRAGTDLLLIKRTIFLRSPSPNHGPNPNSTHHHFNPNSNSTTWLIKTEEIDHGKFRLVHPFSWFPAKHLPKSFPELINLSDIRILELGHEYVLRFTCDDCFPMFHDEKVAYLPIGNDDDYAVLTINESKRLALFRSVVQQWKILDFAQWSFYDVVSFNGVFYAVDYSGSIVAVSPDSGDVMVVVDEPVSYGDGKYLVQMGNELILVVMYHDITNALTESEQDEEEEENQGEVCFSVFKLDMDGKKWDEIDDLGDRVLFLGSNCTFSASASDLKWYDSKGDYIYYNNMDYLFWAMEDYKVACRSVRVFDMNTMMDCHHDHPYYLKLFWPVPSWITSTP